MRTLRNSIIATGLTGIFLFTLHTVLPPKYEIRTNGSPKIMNNRLPYDDKPQVHQRMIRPDIISTFSKSTLGLEVGHGSEVKSIMQHSRSIPVPLAGNSMMSINHRALTPLPQQSQKPITGLILEPRMEGNAARVEAWALLSNMSDQYWHLKRVQEPLGSFLLREGESARLEALARYGFEPITIKAVSAKMTDVSLDQAPVKNSVQAIEITSVKRQLDTYFISMRNRSDKTIVGYAIGEKDTSRGLSLRREHTYGIGVAPGQMFPDAVVFNRPVGGRMTPQGFVPDPPRESYVMVAFFSDGSFDGDEEMANQIISCRAERREGRNKELSFVLPQLRELTDVPFGNLYEALERVKAQISKFPTEEKQARKKVDMAPAHETHQSIFDFSRSQVSKRIQQRIEQIQGWIKKPDMELKYHERVMREHIKSLIEDCEDWMKNPDSVL
jgi:hypothetical protein